MTCYLLLSVVVRSYMRCHCARILSSRRYGMLVFYLDSTRVLSVPHHHAVWRPTAFSRSSSPAIARPKSPYYPLFSHADIQWTDPLCIQANSLRESHTHRGLASAIGVISSLIASTRSQIQIALYNTLAPSITHASLFPLATNIPQLLALGPFRPS